mmetsp:Transcript_109201/g.307951  ORF Transcript_109201/g.307951 Transcript_109201/m.307951 type:complete len:207 (-) Transcript_109201:48-668(-)
MLDLSQQCLLVQRRDPRSREIFHLQRPANYCIIRNLHCCGGVVAMIGILQKSWGARGSLQRRLLPMPLSGCAGSWCGATKTGGRPWYNGRRRRRSGPSECASCWCGATKSRRPWHRGRGRRRSGPSERCTRGTNGGRGRWRIVNWLLPVRSCEASKPRAHQSGTQRLQSARRGHSAILDHLDGVHSPGRGATSHQKFLPQNRVRPQ